MKSKSYEILRGILTNFMAQLIVHQVFSWISSDMQLNFQQLLQGNFYHCLRFLFFSASHFLVFCNNDAMTAVFKRADLPKHVNVDQLYLRDVRCKASYNSTHVFINTALTGCGTLYKETEQMMFFTNTLSERSLNAPGGAVISRNYLFEANFTCSYGRKRTVGTFSFEPAKQRLFVNLGRYVRCPDSVVFLQHKVVTSPLPPPPKFLNTGKIRANYDMVSEIKKESIAVFWFDAKAGKALFQFYKRWRFFRSLFREVFPFSAIFGETPTLCYLLCLKAHPIKFGQFYKNSILGQFNAPPPPQSKWFAMLLFLQCYKGCKYIFSPDRTYVWPISNFDRT